MFSVPEGNWLKTCLIVFCSPGRPEAEPKNGRPSESKLIWCVLVVGFFFFVVVVFSFPTMAMILILLRS